jgi:hypothetical protein
MSTSDGISDEDWDVISDLAVEMARLLVERERCRDSMLAALQTLEEKYGPRPGIVATRAGIRRAAHCEELIMKGQRAGQGLAIGIAIGAAMGVASGAAKS